MNMNETTINLPDGVIELIHNVGVLPDGPNIRINKNIDEVWIKFIDLQGKHHILAILSPEKAIEIAMGILQICK